MRSAARLISGPSGTPLIPLPPRRGVVPINNESRADYVLAVFGIGLIADLRTGEVWEIAHAGPAVCKPHALDNKWVVDNYGSGGVDFDLARLPSNPRCFSTRTARYGRGDEIESDQCILTGENDSLMNHASQGHSQSRCQVMSSACQRAHCRQDNR